MRALKSAFQLIILIGVLVLFFTSIELLGDGFKLMGRGFAEAMIATTANPVVGLFIGILATSLVQSSSTVTSMTVTMVAGGGLSIAGAIPIIMGANVGTSVTNTIVSLGSVSRTDEFRRAMAGATVHDFFNLLTVAILFPLELAFKIVSRAAAVLTDALAGIGGTELLSPVALLVDPVATYIVEAANGSGPAVLVVGLVLLFISLRQLVVLLKSLVMGRAERLLHKYIFGTIGASFIAGIVLTVMVQSSSITTSVVVPMVGAGILTVTQIFPFVLGANIGTTITAILAALILSAGGEVAGIAALKVAFAHLFFNIYGILMFLPFKRMRQIPIWMANRLGDLSARRRIYALSYVLAVFFLIPILIIALTRNIDFQYEPPLPSVLEESGVTPGDTVGVDTIDVDTLSSPLSP